MDRAVVNAEKPVREAHLASEVSGFVPREQQPQQAAQTTRNLSQDSPPIAKRPAGSAQSLLAKLVKDLGHDSDPDLRDAARARKKALKAVLTCLQDAKSSHEEQQGILLKTLLAQATEGRRLEQQVIPLQQKYESAVRSHKAAEQEAAKKGALNQKLQELCRSLQSSNGLFKEQLQRRTSFEEAGQQQTQALQESLASITARLDEEKDRFEHLHGAAEQNTRLREQIPILGRQIEVQQQLINQQDAQMKAANEILEKHQEEAKSREALSAGIIADLQKQNRGLHQQSKRQEELLDKQQAQFQECNQAVREVMQGFEAHQQTLKEKQAEIDSLSTELRKCLNFQKHIREECGPNVVEAFRKLKAQKVALESLCRALQEEKRSLKLPTETALSCTKSEKEGSAEVLPESPGFEIDPKPACLEAGKEASAEMLPEASVQESALSDSRGDEAATIVQF